jgi:hypothetical protein
LRLARSVGSSTMSKRHARTRKRDAVDIGRVQIGPVVTGNIGAAEVVSKDENNVGLAIRRIGNASAPDAIAAIPSAAPRSIVRREISAGVMMKNPPTGISLFDEDYRNPTAPEKDCDAVERLRRKCFRNDK